MTTRGTGRNAAVLLTSALVLAGAVGCSSDDDGATASTTVEVGSRGGGTFRLLSYNVAGLPVEISKEHPDVNLPLISPLLDDYDVVLTQEDFDWWPEDGLVVSQDLDFVNYHERLRADATHEHRSERHPGLRSVDIEPGRPVEIGDGLGFLSKLPIEGNDRVAWTGCFGGFDTSDGGAADCLAIKGFAMTRLTLDDGAVVDLYDLHGEAGGSEADQALQADDFEQLAAYVVKHSEGHAVILGGDTNLHTDPPGPDAHEDSGDGADLEIWTAFLEATGLTDAGAATGCDEPGRIDKVAFRSGDGVDLTAESHDFRADRFVDAAGEDLSDHQALAVTFAWKQA